MLWKGKEKPAKFLISSQIFKCKLHVITRHPDLGKTDSINWLALNPCYCTKAALAPWSQFNFESLLSEHNGMSANLCQQFQRILIVVCVSAVTHFALSGNSSSHSATEFTCETRESSKDKVRAAEAPFRAPTSSQNARDTIHSNCVHLQLQSHMPVSLVYVAPVKTL